MANLDANQISKTEAKELEKEMKFYLDWINETSLHRNSTYADYDIEPKELRSFWRTIPVTLYLFGIISSMVWVVALGGAQNDFRGFCVLFSTIKYTLLGSVPVSQLDLNVTHDDENALEYHHDHTRNMKNILNPLGPLEYSGTNIFNRSRNASQLKVPNSKKVLPEDDHDHKGDEFLLLSNHEHPVAAVSPRGIAKIPTKPPPTFAPGETVVPRYNFQRMKGYGTDKGRSQVMPRGKLKPSRLVAKDNDGDETYVSVASIDYIYSSWGPVCICNFSLYVGVTSLFYGFLCCMFFSLCQMGKQQYSMLEHPSRLVLPTLLLSFIFSLLTVVSSWMISKGVSLWCQGIINGPLDKCEDVENFIWINNERHIMNSKKSGTFYSFLQVAKVSSWLTSLFWITSTLVLMVRFFGAVDFYKEPYILYEPVGDEDDNKCDHAKSTALGLADENHTTGNTVGTLKQPHVNRGPNFKPPTLQSDRLGANLPLESEESEEEYFVSHTPSDIYAPAEHVN